MSKLEDIKYFYQENKINIEMIFVVLGFISIFMMIGHSTYKIVDNETKNHESSQDVSLETINYDENVPFFVDRKELVVAKIVINDSRGITYNLHTTGGAFEVAQYYYDFAKLGCEAQISNLNEISAIGCKSN